jgi:hypothetical protein
MLNAINSASHYGRMLPPTAQESCLAQTKEMSSIIRAECERKC